MALIAAFPVNSDMLFGGVLSYGKALALKVVYSFATQNADSRLHASF